VKGAEGDVALAGRWLEAAGAKLRVRVGGPAGGAGDGLPIVMIHGLGVSGRTLLPLARRLAADRAVLVPDLPGFGRSPAPRSPHARALDVAGLAAAVASAMSAMGWERAAVLGHSLGCQVAVELADRFPQRVGRLVLVAPTVDRGAPTAGGQIARLLRDSYREPPSLLPLAAWDYLAAGPWRVFATLRFALADRMELKLQWIEVPALVVRGGRDPLVSDRWAAEVARRLPAGGLATLRQAAHAVPYSSPVELAEIVRDFLGR
jgi:2-hydroxy-6-oxonona-2,4-dienedioate hydrolase